MIIPLLFLIGATIVLAKSSDWTIDGATTIARYLRLSDLVIGFLLLSFATSLPELSVALASGASNAGGISLGDILGSNIVNLTIAVGVVAIIAGEIIIRKEDIKNLSRVVLASIIIIPFILLNSSLGLIHGVVLIVLFLIYLFYTLHERISIGADEERISRKKAVRGLGYFILGIVLVLVSAFVVIDNAIVIIDYFGITESFLGATLIALGTSLPELTIGLRAVKKKYFNLALGNALGSCIINLTLILGITSILAPFSFERPIVITIGIFAIFSAIIMYYFIKTKSKLTKHEGMFLFLIYILYLVAIFIVQYFHFF